MIQPKDACTKTGEPVIEIYGTNTQGPRSLRKNPHLLPSPTSIAGPYQSDEDTVIEFVQCLYRGARLGGTDSISLQCLLLSFGEAIDELRKIFAEFTECLANERPSWAAYLALISDRFIVLDKQPCVRPMGVG